MDTEREIDYDRERELAMESYYDGPEVCPECKMAECFDFRLDEEDPSAPIEERLYWECTCCGYGDLASDDQVEEWKSQHPLWKI